MSKISADTVEAKTTNGDLVLQGNGTGVPDLASGTKLNGTALTDTFSTPNLIINGDMRIAQRSVSETSVTTAGYKTCDRWYFNYITLGTWTLTQNADAPEGFASSFRAEVTTADASPAVGDRVILAQPIEGNNLANLKKGSASAEPVTLSFYVRSAKTGTHIAEIYDNDNNRHINISYTIDVADTWEFKTITFAGDTSGALVIDNSTALTLGFWVGAGTTFTSGSLQTSWGTAVSANRAVGQVNVADTIGNIFALTGVKLEVGSTATAFVPDDYATALAKCYRYFEKVTIAVYSTVTRNSYSYKATKRALPTSSLTVGTVVNTYANFISFSHGSDAATVATLDAEL